MTSSQTITRTYIERYEFINGSSIFTVACSTGTTATTRYVLPDTTGPIGSVLTTDATGILKWNNPFSYSYTPNNDYYQSLTNQLVPIDVVNGVPGNTGGTDIVGNPGTFVSSIFIVTPPKYGSLNIGTGGTGTFLYRSFPRYVGRDSFYYTIVDNAGLTSRYSAMCEISVESPTPLYRNGYSGAFFIYGTTADANVYYHSGLTESILFTASYTGGSGTGVACLATNRDDNLIYYTAYNATGVTASRRIYAYDYVNLYNFYLGEVTGSNFTSGSAVYWNKNLFITQFSGGTSYHQIVVAPYVYTGGVGSQTMSIVNTLALKGQGIGPTSLNCLANHYATRNLLISGMTGATGSIKIVKPTTAIGVKQNLMSGTAGLLTAGPEGLIYGIIRGTTGIKSINVNTGTMNDTITTISQSSIASIGEYINTLS